MPNCKIGDLCIVKSSCSKNNSKIVKIIGQLENNFVFPGNFILNPKLGKIWQIDAFMNWYEINSDKPRLNIPYMADCALIPIAGDRFCDEEEIKVDKELPFNVE